MMRAGALAAGLGLGPPVLDGALHRAEGAAEVHADHGVPVVDGHVHEHAVADDAGVGDDGVEAAEGVDGGVDEASRRRPSR